MLSGKSPSVANFRGDPAQKAVLSRQIRRSLFARQLTDIATPISTVARVFRRDSRVFSGRRARGRSPPLGVAGKPGEKLENTEAGAGRVEVGQRETFSPAPRRSGTALWRIRRGFLGGASPACFYEVLYGRTMPVGLIVRRLGLSARGRRTGVRRALAFFLRALPLSSADCVFRYCAGAEPRLDEFYGSGLFRDCDSISASQVYTLRKCCLIICNAIRARFNNKPGIIGLF